MKNKGSILKKILLRKNEANLLKNTAGSLGIEALILDGNGDIIAELGEPASKEYAFDFPLKIKDEKIGTVKGNEKAFILASILNYMAENEIVKRDLIDEISIRYKELSLFYNFTEKIHGCTDIDDIAGLTFSEISEFMPVDNMSIMLKDEDEDIINVISVCSGKKTENSSMVSNGKSIAEHVMFSRKAEIINDLSLDPRFTNSRNMSSMICAPLKIEGKIIGAIDVTTENPSIYSSSDLKLFTAFSDNVAVSIENVSLYRDLRDIFISTVYTLAETIEMRDNYTGNHTKRVMEYSVIIGEALGISKEELETLRLSAILHDIGKIGIGDDVLLKPSSLTMDEFELIKKHPLFGEKILKKIKKLEYIVAGVKQHHERYDGKGYPDGLKGDEIDILAKIISVADTFDAMTTDRPYRKSLDLNIAFNELKNCSGMQFDPKIVEVFINAFQHLDNFHN